MKETAAHTKLWDDEGTVEIQLHRPKKIFIKKQNSWGLFYTTHRNRMRSWINALMVMAKAPPRSKEATLRETRDTGILLATPCWCLLPLQLDREMVIRRERKRGRQREKWFLATKTDKNS
jgi:hypothetical protein